MITRIKIEGFKSLLNTELYFGPFTCIAGANAVGKSNLFDAIAFLSSLADNAIIQAAKSIRSEDQKHSSVKDIFFRSGNDYVDTIKFEIDMIVPEEGEDDLGQIAKAKITSLRYVLELKLNENDDNRELVEIIREDLLPITQKSAQEHLHFDYSKEWIESILSGRRGTNNPFISTQGEKIKLHQDGGSSEGKKGRSSEVIAQRMPRTLLSTVTAESPTAFLARREMRSWTMLQFEPSALRQPNSIFEVKNAFIDANGLNLPATLYRLNSENTEADVYQNLTNRLKDLVDNIDEIQIDKDEKRDLLTLQVRFKDGLILPAQSLSDGTLRFLGLASIEADNKTNNVICLEEPENGINPKKIEQMLNLLVDMATDTEEPVDDSNSFRQVIINSHSPLIVRNTFDESLYFAKEKEIYLESFKRKVKFTSFSAINNTWRTKEKLSEITSKGDMISYLENTSENFSSNTLSESGVAYSFSRKKKTVAENLNQTTLF